MAIRHASRVKIWYIYIEKDIYKGRETYGT